MGTHEEWMSLACQLAQAAQGQTSPNPVVGAVAVKGGRLVGLGTHLKAGTPHAEVYALRDEETRGCTLYVTLEPCNHTGRTPPCTERIIERGVKKVYVGALDPDPKVSGRGIACLQEAGIEVVRGVLEEECIQLNEAYFYHRRTGQPFVTLKTASTLDGKIATESGDSRWITNKTSLTFVHALRHQHDAILVGIGTVLADDPALTTRQEAGGVHPIRVIVDSRLQVPLDAQVVTDKIVPTWIFTTDYRDEKKEKTLLEQGIQVISTGSDPEVNLEYLLDYLGQRGVLSVLVEGGGTVNASLLAKGLIHKVYAFIAPKLLGGKSSPTAIEGESPLRMMDAHSLCNVEVRRFAEDICVVGYLEGYRCSQG